MIKFSHVSLAFVGLTLAACTGPVIMGTDAAIIVVTKPSGPPPADVDSQIPQHESWCYKTMGDIECYAHPQNVVPGRLVNVDPQNRYPVDLQAYHDLVTPPPPPVVLTATDAAQPVIMPAMQAPVIQEDIPPPPPKAVHPAKKKKHKKPKSTKPKVAQPPAPPPATPALPPELQ